MAPLRVAGLMEFHVFETEPLMLRTYCIPPDEGQWVSAEGSSGHRKLAEASDGGENGWAYGLLREMNGSELNYEAEE